MAATGAMITSAGKVSIGLARSLLQGIEPSSAASFARPGGKVVESNHPAWVFGHLSLYAPRVVELLGQDAAAIRPPEGFDSLFKAGSVCTDDPKGLIHPPLGVITDCFFKGYHAALAAIAEAPEEVFAREMPEERRAFMPTVGAAAMFLVCSHPMMHLGQVSAWRRMMGLPPAALS